MVLVEGHDLRRIGANYPVGMKLITVTEGQTRLEVPNPDEFRTKAGDYVPSLAEVFYNPRMELNRDISVSAAHVSAKRLGSLWACDPLSGVGARGVRYAMEVSGISEILANDRSPRAAELISRNVEMNGVGNLVQVQKKDANVILHENKGRFNFIDLDPFGSPAPFLEAACAAISRKGVLAATATDTAPLCGSQELSCVRRYGARPLKTEYCRELGVRILIGFAQRVAGKHDLALVPILSHATQHYFRVCFSAEHGAKKSDEVLRNIGHVSHCFKCGRRVVSRGVASVLPDFCKCGNGLSHAGPLWIGSLADSDFVKDVIVDVANRSFRLGFHEVSLLSLCAEESAGPPTFYNVNELSSTLKKPPPRMDILEEKVEEAGFFFSRTHFSGSGFRTDAPFEEIEKTFISVPR